MKGVDLAMNHSNVKSTTKKRAKAVLSVFLVVAILIAGAYAFLSATDSKTNVFTVGNVKIELWEDFNGTTYNGQQTPDPVENIIPGQTIDKKPYIKNTGKNNAWMFMAVGVPTATDENIASNTFPNGVKIEVKAFGIQESYNNANTAIDTWKSYFTADKVASTLGTVVTNTEKELFTLNEPTNSGWTKLDDTYRVDGYVYHIFALDTVAAPATNEFDGFTTAPFESVTFNESVGKENAESETIITPDNLDLSSLSSKVVSDTVVMRAITNSQGDISEIVFYSDNYTIEQIKNTSVGYNEDEPKGTPLMLSDILNHYDASQISVKPYSMAGKYQERDIIIEMEGDYIYNYFAYKDDASIVGWWASVKDPSKTSYVNIAPSKFGVPVIKVEYENCINLIKAPVIPDGIIFMDSSFGNCSSLTEAPIIPSSVRDVTNCFYECTSLSGSIEVNATLTDMSSCGNGFVYHTQVTEITGSTPFKTELLATKG